MYEYSIIPHNDKFEVLYLGESITGQQLICDTFGEAREYILEQYAEQKMIEGEREIERFIAMNYDECGYPFRYGDEDDE